MYTHWSATTLNPLIGEVNNIETLVPGIHVDVTLTHTTKTLLQTKHPTPHPQIATTFPNGGL